MAQCSTAFKSLATELDIPVVVLSQIGRDGEGGHPRLSNLKETGQLEQDADIAILIAELEDGLHLDVAKNRDGKKTVLPVEFIGKYMRFYGGRDDSRWM
jgi:replicative DNA helicase